MRTRLASPPHGPLMYESWIDSPGYIQISGRWVTAIDDFLMILFPKVHEGKMHAKNNYCKYDDRYLQLLTSSLYLAAPVSSCAASKMHQHITELVLQMLQSPMKLIYQAVPLFLSEIAPTEHRGAVNILFQLFPTIGMFFENLVNYSTSNRHPYGWRVSLRIAGHCPVHRGVEDVDSEFEQIVIASKIAQEVKHPCNKLMNCCSMPPLIIGVMLQFFQQFTGINAVVFYAPVLLQTIGFKNDASFLFSVITGSVNVFVSVFAVVKFHSRIPLLKASIQMFVCQTVIGAILLVHLHATDSLTKTQACETFSLETRTAEFAFAVSSNMLFTFIIAQALFLLPEAKDVPIDAME
ncbi:hypothetical protein GOBAR_AA18674 [Gossypium barbadense]|uniref:Major facilitator superfamily (MFS) profile domain-containing protein n=1 Tax=Gossypium barbadense TaxID=3634 RepID=A0A2P5XF98_GOSBA|nr:hypothetical protein GOBAR_AA18674 [Gossypium barbadense]